MKNHIPNLLYSLLEPPKFMSEFQTYLKWRMSTKDSLLPLRWAQKQIPASLHTWKCHISHQMFILMLKKKFSYWINLKRDWRWPTFKTSLNQLCVRALNLLKNIKKHFFHFMFPGLHFFLHSSFVWRKVLLLLLLLLLLLSLLLLLEKKSKKG